MEEEFSEVLGMKAVFIPFGTDAPDGGKLVAWFPIFCAWRPGGADFVATIGAPDEAILAWVLRLCK